MQSSSQPEYTIDKARLISVLEKFSLFPKHLLWMFAVDGRLYVPEDGPEQFDARENGSIEGILNGLAGCVRHLCEPLSLELYLETHRQCLLPIHPKTKIMQPGKVRTHPTRTTIFAHCADDAGLETMYQPSNLIVGVSGIPTGEALEREQLKFKRYLSAPENKGVSPAKLCAQFQQQKYFEYAKNTMSDPTLARSLNPYGNDPNLDLRIKEDEAVTRKSKPKEIEAHLKELKIHIKKGLPLIYAPPNPPLGADEKKASAYLEKLMQGAIERYSVDIADAKTTLQKIKVIATHVQDSVKTHLTGDGCNRTSVNNMLNFLLLQQGLLPIILEDPNVFECTSIARLIVLIQEGLMRTDQLIRDPEIKIFGYDSSTLNPRFIKKFSTASHELMTAIQTMLQKLRVDMLHSTSSITFFPSEHANIVQTLLENARTDIMLEKKENNLLTLAHSNSTFAMSSFSS